MIVGIIIGGVVFLTVVVVVAFKKQVCRRGKRGAVSIRHNNMYTEVVENDIFNVNGDSEDDGDDEPMLELENGPPPQVDDVDDDM